MNIKFGDISYTFDELKNVKTSSMDMWMRNLVDCFNNYMSKETITFKTSGSTGIAKEISFDKNAIKESIKLTKNAFHLKNNIRVLHCLPTHYVAGQMMLYRAIENNWEIDAIEPKISLSQSLTGNYSFAAMIPLQVEDLLDRSPHLLNKIETLIVGGSPIKEHLARRLQLVKTKVFETYGMTETLTNIASRAVNGTNRSPFFKSFKGIKLNQDQRGCLTIYAPHISDDPIVTNDIVEFEDFDQFKLIGRADRVINIGGVKIQAENIEIKIDKYLNRNFHIGKTKDEKIGEKVILYIEGDSLDAVSLKLLRNMMEESLSKFEIPSEIVFIKVFQRTKSGKIKIEQEKR